MECRQDLQVIIPELESCLEEIAAAGKQLSAHQHRRQQDIWMLVKVAVSSVCTLCGEVGKKLHDALVTGRCVFQKSFRPGKHRWNIFHAAILVAVIPEGHSATSKGRCHYLLKTLMVTDMYTYMHAFMYVCPPAAPRSTHPHLH